ncbi:hypothetical protein HHK36_005394 [Tetracentron sinense]|uniref:Uncharacterized protein n=1 Tax=Tetracentron sinense TaxID=13715 RepID=A0A834ZPB2_TETSI|nr:hypothetical protein HHK36_005394 [Tetracentron sinense]
MISNGGSTQSNLECFIDCTTPVVPSQSLPKTAIRNLNRLWHPWDRETVDFFTLGDFWSCYDEWSVYGAGVPIGLSNKETVVQYYVPYLSAIQIFTSNSSLTSFRYPIYHIPTGRTVKDLSTCFLTYHTLSSSFQDMGPEEDTGSSERKRKEGEGIALPPFGLVTYKMKGSVWVSGESGHNQERLMSLLSAADSWLKQLRVQHHDFNYFTGIRHG